MNCDLDHFLTLADGGATAESLCEASGLRLSRVYGLLRKHRPDRPRQRRRPSSDMPVKVRGVLAAGIEPRRVAFLLGITPAYVYRIRGKQGTD